MRTVRHQGWILLLSPLLMAGCQKPKMAAAPPASQPPATEPAASAPATAPTETFSLGDAYFVLHGPGGKPLVVNVGREGEVHAATLPAHNAFRIGIGEAIWLAQSVIRGEHFHEWAEAVAKARDADPDAKELRSGLNSILLGPLEKERRLAIRFLHDVRAKDGPDWMELVPEADVPPGVVRQMHLTPETSLAVCVKALESGDFYQRQAGLIALGRMGANARPAIPKMAERLRSELPEERNAAVDALARLAKTLPEVAEALAAALNDERMDTRLAAIDAFGASGLPQSVDFLGMALKEGQVEVRRRAAGMLARLSPNDPAAGAALVNVIQDNDPEIRKLASGMIARPDVQAVSSIASLIAALWSENPLVRRDAAYALRERKADGEDVMLALTVAVDEGNFIVREALGHALDRAAREGSTAVVVLKAEAEGTDPIQQAYARSTLKSIEAQRKAREKP